MKLRRLRYFLAVAEASNFSKAAPQLQVAQPALSRQVRDLENEIGVELCALVRAAIKNISIEGRTIRDSMAPLLQKLIQQYATTGLPPAYLPKQPSNTDE
jgi:LysR family transcriptional regulator, benzoate and cis,cis-muconate-responsive activator of ben and cat genes